MLAPITMNARALDKELLKVSVSVKPGEMDQVMVQVAYVAETSHTCWKCSTPCQVSVSLLTATTTSTRRGSHMLCFSPV